MRERDYSGKTNTSSAFGTMLKSCSNKHLYKFNSEEQRNNRANVIINCLRICLHLFFTAIAILKNRQIRACLTDSATVPSLVPERIVPRSCTTISCLFIFFCELEKLVRLDEYLIPSANLVRSLK